MCSVWACGLEFVMLRMAFFCMIKFFSMLGFDVQLTMSGQYTVEDVSGRVTGIWLIRFSEGGNFLFY